MMWLLGVGTWLKNAISAAFALVVKYPVIAAVIALVCLSAWLWHGKQVALDRADAFKQVAVDEIRAHKATKANYRTAQEQAAKLEAARLERVKVIQESINDTSKESYERRLADLRTRYDRLRAQSGASADGKAGTVAVPGVSVTAGGTSEAPRDELSWRLTAAEQSIQLDELISWVKAQAGVAVN